MNQVAKSVTVRCRPLRKLGTVHHHMALSFSTSDGSVPPHTCDKISRWDRHTPHFRRSPKLLREGLPLSVHSCWHPSLTPTKFSAHHQWLQRRYFDSRKVRKRRKRKNPFHVLSMPQGSLYKDVKRKFLKIAMVNHPDTHSEDLTDEERGKMRDIFIETRIAFESLTEDSDGTAILWTEKQAEDAMDNFDSWFKSETGLNTPFDFDMDPETMKEVAKMTESIGGDSGLDRDGGMWALARMVTSVVKTGGDAATILRLESGDIKGRNASVNGELRRRRKR